MSKRDGEFEPIESRVPESLLRRMVLDAAGQKYGTRYGAMRLRGQLNDAQFNACKSFDELYADYLAALDSPRGVKTSTGERVSKGHPPDPFSEIGLKIADDEHKLVKRYEGARMAGMACGREQFKLFWYVVIDGAMPVGYASVKAAADVSSAIDAYLHRNKTKHKRGRR